MSGHPDIQRLVGDILRYGTIGSVDLGARRCTVKVGDLESGAIPWVAGRAGGTAHWSPPTVGEQCILLCPEGDIAAGVALLGVYSDANASPSTAEKLDLHRYADGATVSYDAAGHHYSITLPAGATAAIAAPGGLTIAGDVTITGKLIVSEDVTGAGISLQHHKHGKVQAGSAETGEPQ